MEQHPVPQNITTFQFRLIGDMTIKQFGYLGGGIALAFIAYKLPLPFFFTWPLAAIFALTGFGFAFVPIEERPMDTWVFSFIRNVYNPTVFHWERTPKTPDPVPGTLPSTPKLPTFTIPTLMPTLKPTVASQKTIPTTLQQQIQKPVIQRGRPSSLDTFFSWIDNLFVPHSKVAPLYQTTPPRGVMPPTSVQIPQMPLSTTPSITGTKPVTPEKLKTSEPAPEKIIEKELQQEEAANKLKTKVESLQKELQGKTTVDARYLEMQKQLTELMTQRLGMEKEIITLRTRLQTQQAGAPTFRQAGVTDVPTTIKPNVTIMGNEAATRAGLPRLTTFPNVVTGIIKDNENTLLPGVLVTVKDADGVPLRALKSNKLGQFAASTPLNNGTYLIEVEDPRKRFLFDRVQITLNGSIMPAVQIVAKSQKELSREKLSKEIFGSPSANS